MKKIETIHAVGHVLCHDVTQIIKDKTKGPVFRKGHIVTEEDIPVLLSVGKDHLYVWEKNENMLHENEAAEILFDLCRSEGMKGSEIKEGKIEVIADRDGLLKIDRKKLFAVNSLSEMMIASRHGDFPVKKGDKIAGTRIIPLVIEKEKMERAKEAAEGGPIFRILPFHKKKTAIVTTGNEVFYGRIKDTFGPVVKEKIAEYPTEFLGQTLVDDQKDGKKIPIVGLPGCVMYAKRTVFDLVLPRLMADDPVTFEELAALGEGGLCLNCGVCTFPNCGFGKGVVY